MVIGKVIWLLALTLAPIATAKARTVQTDEIVIRGDAARVAIERILDADNLDVSSMSPREVAGAMAQIERGRAPTDFWWAYQRHARAWQEFAEAKRRSRRMKATDPDLEDVAKAVVASDREINSTFDEVERLARRYGARVPSPRRPINVAR